MLIHQIQDLSNSKVIKILEQGLSQVTEPNLIKNYHPDYCNNNANLFFILENGRYKIGNYFVAEEDGEYIGSSGWNWYEDDIVLALTRTYILPKHRQKYLMANTFLPMILEETTSYNRIWATVNTYNKVMYDGVLRMIQGKPAGLHNKWPEVYKNMVPLGIKTINYTEQYVVEYIRNHSE